MNFRELKKFFEKRKIDVSDIGNEDYYLDDESEAELGEIKKVDRHGGEGRGEDWHVVYYLPKHNIYFRIDAYYSSYGGINFEDSYLYEVIPSEKTITIYTAK